MHPVVIKKFHSGLRDVTIIPRGLKKELIIRTTLFHVVLCRVSTAAIRPSNYRHFVHTDTPTNTDPHDESPTKHATSMHFVPWKRSHKHTQTHDVRVTHFHVAGFSFVYPVELSEDSKWSQHTEFMT